MLEKGPNGFNAKLRAALKDCGCFVSQIESETGRGIPDFHASHVAVGPFWVECKVSFTVKKVTVEVRPNQIVIKDLTSGAVSTLPLRGPRG